MAPARLAWFEELPRPVEDKTEWHLRYMTGINFMKPMPQKINLHGFCVLTAAALCGCSTYVDQRPRPVSYDPPPREVYTPQPPPREVYTPQPPPPVRQEYGVEVEVRSEQDFYEPLRPYGRWENVEGHGRCWVPDRVDRDWRPYTNGHWQRTDAGWYWVSEEPWAWATYHYGRWDFHASLGWYWVPEVQWAPAWVSWHQGGGYVGWAPLAPTVHFSENRIDTYARPASQRAYVFVEERRFLEPVRPTTVVNNTTIVNNTVNITNIKVVNKTVINEGPPPQVIERASGRKIQAVQAREERRRTEASVSSRQRSGTERISNGQTPQSTPPPGQAGIVRDPRAQPAPRYDSSSAETDRRVRELDAKARVEEQRRQNEAAKAQTETARRATEDKRRAQEEAVRQGRLPDRQTREQADMRAREEQRRLETDRHNQELDAKAKMEAERRARGTGGQGPANTVPIDRAALPDRQNREPAIAATREEQRRIEADRHAQALEERTKMEADRRAKEADRQALSDSERRARAQERATQSQEKRLTREQQAELELRRRETNRLANPSADRRTRQQQAADEKARRDADRRGVREPVPISDPPITKPVPISDPSITNSTTPAPK
jgi:hypothetical protein